MTSEGTQGWRVTNYRDITYPDGTMTTEEWGVFYRGNPKIIDMHPCDAPAGTRDAWNPDSEACQIPEEPDEGDGDGDGDGGGDGG